MKINFFRQESPLFPLRWLIVATICITSLLFYANVTGWRLLSFSGQQEWKANGPGYHK